MNRTPPRLWDLPSAVLLILALLTSSRRLDITHWTTGLETANVLILIGVVLGLALGFSTLGQRTISWFLLGFSIPVVILVLGSILYRDISWLERLANLGNRLTFSIDQLIKKQPVQDTTLFVVFMALVYWVIGLIAGYATTHFGNIIGAVLPAGVVFVIIQVYDAGRAGSDALLAIYFVFSLLLLGRLTYAKRKSFWKEKRVSLLAESKADLNITLAAVALGTVLLVWLAPTSAKSFSDARTAWENLTKPLRDVQKNLGHAVVGLQATGRITPVQFYSDVLTLGQQAATGETVYIKIQTPMVNNTSRFYWRVRSYDTFLNDRWYAENISNEPFSPGQALISLPDSLGVTSKFTFIASSVNMAELVTPARPVWVSNPSKLFFVQVPQGKTDPIEFRPNSPILAGKQYNVRANEYEPTILQLRNAGKSYPDWVTSRYLQLPEKLSPAIVSLAKSITTDAETPYDQADAITNYLRSNITYSKDVKAPPSGVDPLDWFLFDSKSGFCNYYATAEVILLRAVGIPARMVVGFAQGKFENPDYYVIRQQDSHAWPEVYFPGMGWVEFEPTANQLPLKRALGEDFTSPTQANSGSPTGPNEAGPGNPKHAVVQGTRPLQETAAGLLLEDILRITLIWVITETILRMYILGEFDKILRANHQVTKRSLPGLLKHFLEKRALTPPAWLVQWAYLAELNPIARSYMTVYRSLQWLGEKPFPSLTPAEAAEILARHLPNASQEIYSLLDEYHRHLYSQKHGYLFIARRAVKVIRRETIRVAIQQRWRGFRGILRIGPE